MSVTLVTRPVFARMHNVSKASVQKWEKRGAIVVVDGKVSVEASDRLLMHAGLGRFSERARRAKPKAAPPSPPPTMESDGEALPPAGQLLVAYFNRIAAFAALSAWEHGVTVDTARQIDVTFRVVAMEAVTDLLTELGVPPPPGVSWDDAPIWDEARMSQVDWSVAAQDAPGAEQST